MLLFVGEGGDFALLLADGDPQRPLPEGDLFRGTVPEGFILETLLAPDQVGWDRGLVRSFRLVPLTAGDFELGPFSFFPEVPLIPISVRDGPGESGPANSIPDSPSVLTVPPDFPDEEILRPFPSGKPPGFLPFAPTMNGPGKAP
jgi:hypothetical protein